MSSNYLKKPILSKKIEYTCSNGFAFTTCEMQGWRKHMEDSQIFIEVADHVYLFGVFDGHGGPEVSSFVAQNFPKELMKDPVFKSKNYSLALTNVCRKIDDLIGSDKGQEDLKILNKRLNGENLESGEKISYRAGTTASMLLLTKDKYFLANVGDSRAVLSRNYSAVALSNDHKPTLPSQKDRIEKAGGYVHNDRVNGTLGLSRSFGDFDYKFFSKRPYDQQAVISLPQIIEIERRPQDNFVILGCDGIWQKFAANNQGMVNHIKSLRDKFTDRKLVMQNLFNDLVARECKQLLGCDNMTGILIQFL